MFTTNVQNLIFTLLIMSAHTFGNNEYIPHHIKTQPKFDPHLTEYVWFSSFSTNSELDNNKSSSLVNILPIMLSGAVETKEHLSKERKMEQNKVPKVQKIVFRL
jgi:hypothetical protein